MGWLSAATRRNPATPDQWDKAWENRRRMIRELAPGRSFLDLGGMFGIVGDMAFAAEQAGATRVVLFDAMDPSDEFDEKHRRNGSHVEYVQGDLHDPDVVAGLGQFDVVWCTGVIYHTPHPMQQILHLRRLMGDHLVLGTHVIPEVPGIEQACILYPGMSKRMQEAFAAAHGRREDFPGMAMPFDTTRGMAYANMWFGISPSALRSMLHFSALDVVDEYMYSPFWIDVVARPGGVPDIYPQQGQSAERMRERFTGTPTDALPFWARTQMSQIRGS